MESSISSFLNKKESEQTEVTVDYLIPLSESQVPK